jgi:hypothetical protein
MKKVENLTEKSTQKKNLDIYKRTKHQNLLKIYRKNEKP